MVEPDVNTKLRINLQIDMRLPSLLTILLNTPPRKRAEYLRMVLLKVESPPAVATCSSPRSQRPAFGSALEQF